MGFIVFMGWIIVLCSGFGDCVLGVLGSIVVRGVLRYSHRLLPRFVRFFRYRGLALFVPEGVFNPVYTVSTGLIIDALSNVFRPRGVFLEIGCGSGAVSIFVAKYLWDGVEEIYSCDVSDKALATTMINAEINGVIERVKIGNCYKLLPRLKNKVDFAVANPPYLPIDPRDELDYNWCGGSSLNIFKETINELTTTLKTGGQGLITVSSLTSINKATKILREKKLTTKIIKNTKTPLDTIYLIHIIKK